MANYWQVLVRMHCGHDGVERLDTDKDHAHCFDILNKAIEGAGLTCCIVVGTRRCLMQEAKNGRYFASPDLFEKTENLSPGPPPIAARSEHAACFEALIRMECGHNGLDDGSRPYDCCRKLGAALKSAGLKGVEMSFAGFRQEPRESDRAGMGEH